MDWLIYTFTGVFFFAVYYLLSRVFLKDKKSDPVSFAILFNFVCAILVGIVAVKNGFVLPDIHKYAFNLVITALAYSGSQIFVFKALKFIDASDLIIFASTRSIWGIVVALLFLGETFNLQKVIGTGLILFSIIFISLKKRGIRLKIGHVYALLAAVCIGVGYANDAYILRHSDALSYLVFAFLISDLLMVMVFPSAARNIAKGLDFKPLIKMVVLGIINSIGSVAILIAFQTGGNVSQVAPMSQSVVIVTVILAALFLGERENLAKKCVAAILVSIGVLVLR